jgi:glycosyltransferase involved in cell wall biosynthesis
MKILHLDTGTGWRGGQQQVLWLMRGLRERGHEQLLAAPQRSPLAMVMQKCGFEVVALGSPRTSLGNLRELRRIACGPAMETAGGYDILHAHDAQAHSLAWLAGSVRRKRPWPLLVVSRRVGFAVGRFGGPKYAAARAYIAVSDFVRQQLRKAQVPEGRIEVVHDGVEPPAPSKPGARQEFRSRLGLDERTPLLGTLTSLAPEKLLSKEIDLLAELPHSVHLWIGHPEVERGQNGAASALLDYAKRRGLEDRFRILPLSPGIGCGWNAEMGNDSGDDLAGFLESLDVFLYLSRSEGLGSAILLAMAHGLPVVASRTGGIPEIVEDQRTGLLVGANLREELPAAVRSLLDSDRLRRELGRAAKQFVLENATTEAMISKTVMVYERILQQSGAEQRRPTTGFGARARSSEGASGREA